MQTRIHNCLKHRLEVYVILLVRNNSTLKDGSIQSYTHFFLYAHLKFGGGGEFPRSFLGVIQRIYLLNIIFLSVVYHLLGLKHPARLLLLLSSLKQRRDKRGELAQQMGTLGNERLRAEISIAATQDR